MWYNIYIYFRYIYMIYMIYIYIYISTLFILTYPFSHIPSHISRIDCYGIIISHWYQHIPFSFVLAVYHHWLYCLGAEVKMIGLATWMVWSVLPQFQLLSHTEISDGGGHCKLNIHVNIGFVCYSKYPRCFVLLWGFLFFSEDMLRLRWYDWFQLTDTTCSGELKIPSNK
jgi:hypothetical protein